MLNHSKKYMLSTVHRGHICFWNVFINKHRAAIQYVLGDIRPKPDNFKMMKLDTCVVINNDF